MSHAAVWRSRFAGLVAGCGVVTGSGGDAAGSSGEAATCLCWEAGGGEDAGMLPAGGDVSAVCP